MNSEFRYCPNCGAPLAEGVAFGRVRRLCRYCGFIHFHDPKVAVGVLISDGERVLLVRRSVPPRIGFWALPAGYMDYDELPEEAVLRETAEETGLAVRVLALRDVVPLAGWDERRGIMVVYAAEPVSGEIGAADDVSEVAWFAPSDLPWAEMAFESTAEILRDWIASLGSD